MPAIQNTRQVHSLSSHSVDKQGMEHAEQSDPSSQEFWKPAELSQAYQIHREVMALMMQGGFGTSEDSVIGVAQPRSAYGAYMLCRKRGAVAWRCRRLGGLQQQITFSSPGFIHRETQIIDKVLLGTYLIGLFEGCFPAQ